MILTIGNSRVVVDCVATVWGRGGISSVHRTQRHYPVVRRYRKHTSLKFRPRIVKYNAIKLKRW